MTSYIYDQNDYTLSDGTKVDIHDEMTTYRVCTSWRQCLRRILE